MGTDTGTAVGTAFRGADADGLRSNASAMTQAAQVCDEVRSACQAIVAASFFLGPFGAAFIAYLENTVIPWLTKISQALQGLAKILNLHAGAQDDASSATSLPSYSSVGSTPSSGATLPTTTPPSTATLPTTTTPPTLTTAPAGSTLDPATGTPNGQQPDPVGLLQVPVSISPDGQITPLLTTADLGLGGTTATAPTAFGATTNDGTLSGLIDPITSSTPSLSSPLASPLSSPTPDPSPLSALGGHDAAGTGGDTGGGTGGGSGGGSAAPDATGYTPTAPSLSGATPGDPSSAAFAAPSTTPAHHAAAAALHAAPAAGASHDGLFAGLGQATGIGGAGAALARAVIVEARRAALTPTLPGLPADAQADAGPQLQIFDGALG